MFMTLQRDSEYWRGHTGGGKVDASKMTGRGSGGNLNVALVGRVSLNEAAASALADTMDQFGRDHSYVELLNFAFLTIHTKKVVGAGGTAKVYEGDFKGERVAIKLVYPPELTQEEVTGFLREASALEEAGEHENIIKVLGVCVMPPSIALVLEMCEQGDLNSHIRQQSEVGDAIRPTHTTRKARKPMMSSYADSSCSNNCCLHDGLRLVDVAGGHARPPTAIRAGSRLRKRRGLSAQWKRRKPAAQRSNRTQRSEIIQRAGSG